MDGKPKKFFFIYNGDQATGETMEDQFGEFPVPPENIIMRRNGKLWKVVHVTMQTGAKDEWPIVRVSLSESL